MIATAVRRLSVLAALGVVVAAAGCLGGQSAQTRQQSDALGDQSRDVPQATLREHDWNEAAKGHGAAGPIPAAELARMEKQSAPGGNLGGDAGVREAGAPAARVPAP